MDWGVMYIGCLTEGGVLEHTVLFWSDGTTYCMLLQPHTVTYPKHFTTTF